MKRQDRLRKQARHQSLHDRSVIDHLTKSFAGGPADRPARRFDPDAELCERIQRRWTGGLPQF